MPSHKGPGGHGNTGHTGTTDATLSMGQPASVAASANAALAPTIAQVVDSVFTHFDADASGTITAAELVAVLDPKGTRAHTAAEVAALIAGVDTGADGSLSRAEVSAALTTLDTNGDGMLSRADHVRGSETETAEDLLDGLMGHGGWGHGGGVDRPEHGGTPPMAQTVAQVVDAIFTGFDADASTTISLSELLAVADPKGTHTHEAAEITALFAALNTDGDTSLSKAEITAAVTALDTHADGTLDHSDFKPGQAHDNVLELMGVLHHQAEVASLVTG